MTLKYFLAGGLLLISITIFQSGCATVWERVGFTENEAKEWETAGFNAYEAQELKYAGFTPTGSKEWRAAGFSLEQAKELKAAKFTPNEVGDLKTAGFSLEQAQAAISEAKRWKKEGFDGKYGALRWIVAGFTLDQAYQLDIRIDDAEPKTIWDFLKAGFSVDEIARSTDRRVSSSLDGPGSGPLPPITYDDAKKCRASRIDIVDCRRLKLEARGEDLELSIKKHAQQTEALEAEEKAQLTNKLMKLLSVSTPDDVKTFTAQYCKAGFAIGVTGTVAAPPKNPNDDDGTHCYWVYDDIFQLLDDNEALYGDGVSIYHIAFGKNGKAGSFVSAIVTVKGSYKYHSTRGIMVVPELNVLRRLNPNYKWD